MTLRIYAAIAAVLLPLSVVFALGQWWNHRQDGDRWAEQLALKDSVIVTTETSRSALAREVEHERSLVDGLEDDLQDALERLKVKPVQVIRTTIAARPESIVTVMRDTVIEESDGLHPAWPFRARQGRYTVSGQVYPDTRTLAMLVDQDPITLDVVMSETRSGNWLTTVDTGDSTLVISDIQTRVIPRRPGWWARKKFWVGLAIGAGGTAFIMR